MKKHPPNTIELSQQQEEHSNPTSLSTMTTIFNTLCTTTNRCQPLHRHRRMSFIHISKSGGTSWIDELKQVIPTLYFTSEFSVAYQNAHDPYNDRSYHVASMRSPRHHTWSLWAECRFDRWGIRTTRNTKFPRSGTDDAGDVVDFTHWLNHFVHFDDRHAAPPDLVRGLNRPRGYYKCYHPANYQSRAFVVPHRDPHGPGKDTYLLPSLTVAKATYWSMNFVAITEFFHESKCVLFYRLTPKTEEMSAYIESTCRCNVDGDEHHGRRRALETTTNTSAAVVLTDQHNLHYAGRRRKTMRDLDPQLLATIAAGTSVDTQSYIMALRQFLLEVVWLETMLGRRVLCDGPLQKWEDEFAYLGEDTTTGKPFRLTREYERAVEEMKDKETLRRRSKT